jgi:hypothetical protein
MASSISLVLHSLLPKGSAWHAARAGFGQIGAVIEGLADSLERAHVFILGIISESRPGSATATLPEWHRAFGRRYDPTVPIDIQHRMLSAIHTARGGVTINDLNAQMHKELTAVYFSEIAYGGTTSIAGEGECGMDECYSTVAGADANPGGYLITGIVEDDAEAARVESVIEHFAPLHLEPMSLLTILSDTGTTECGLEQCGRTECGYAP